MRRSSLVLLSALGVFAALAACSDAPADPAPPATDAAPAFDAGDEPPVEANGYVWRLPAGFPKPKIPADNPMTDAKVELGRFLFYDTELSENRTQSCASCHVQTLAFTDGLAHSVGSTGMPHPRGAQSLVNVGYASVLTWQNDLLSSLELQIRVPLFGTEPIELGMNGKDAELVARLQAKDGYPARFAEAFPDEPAPSVKNVIYALAAFQRTIVSGDSPFDRFARGDTGALSASAQRGRALFNSELTECFHCHGGFSFADAISHEGTAFTEKPFHNNALYNIDGQGGYPAPSRGLIDVSLRPEDMGRFKAPTLRNIAVTAPYMHDGSIATLEEVIDHYARGGRKVVSGPGAGDGSTSPLKSEFVRGFVLSEEQKTDLIEFLRALTDESFLRDPRYADPFAAPQ